MKIYLFFILIFINAAICNSLAQTPYAGTDPGEAILKTSIGNHLIMENNAFRINFSGKGKKITIDSFEDKNTNERINLNDVPIFELILPDDRVITSNNFTLVNPPAISNISVDKDALTYAKRLPGKKYSADLINKRLGLRVHWESHLRDGSNYIRQILTFTSDDNNPVNVTRINLIKIPLNIEVRKEGTVEGIPMVHNNMFFAIEHPMSKIEKSQTHWIAELTRLVPVSSANAFTVSAVWGITPTDQLRRGFLYYMERERAKPYHLMVHYNSWSDIAWMDREMNERVCLFRIEMIGDSLIKKRNIKLDAFMFDDGWDDNRTIWKFNYSTFPNGFTKLREAAESYGSTLGVWISPFGGYSIAKQLRLEYGRKQNPPFETNKNGFSLAGPIYYQRYKEVLIDFITKYNISMLKFDGVGAGGRASGADIYEKDMEAYLKVITELREIKPDLYFNLTVGTWPSPYFLKYGNSIWRQGGDYGFAGAGTKRQQWITFRDANVYKNIVQRSPLYPLNGLMSSMFYVTDIGEPGEFGMDKKDISDDLWIGYANGSSTLGVYLNPNRMYTAAWDCLADVITWARENESVLIDTHWIGGDPEKGEVYGYASWTPQKALLVLRNPSTSEKTFEVNAASVFELPPANKKNEYLFYDAKSGLATDSKQPVVQGNSFSITLQPFEVIVYNAFPKK